MAKNRDNVRIFGDDLSAVSVAPKGTTGPTGLATLASPIVELGWLSEDGIDFDQDADVTEFKAFQGGALIRKKTTSVDRTFKFQCLESTALTLGLYFPGLVFGTAVASVSKGTIPAGVPSDERLYVIDILDGTVHDRFVVPSGEVSTRGTMSFKNSEITVYEFEVSVYGTFDLITNDPAKIPA